MIYQNSLWPKLQNRTQRDPEPNFQNELAFLGHLDSQGSKVKFLQYG